MPYFRASAHCLVNAFSEALSSCPPVQLETLPIWQVAQKLRKLRSGNNRVVKSRATKLKNLTKRWGMAVRFGERDSQELLVLWNVVSVILRKAARSPQVRCWNLHLLCVLPLAWPAFCLFCFLRCCSCFSFCSVGEGMELQVQVTGLVP